MLDVFHYHAWRRLRAAYYAFGLARMPFGGALGRAVGAWETAQGFGDSPKAKSIWDAEYGNGSWAYMGRQNELARYWTLIGYMDALRRGGEYLDVGCGDGVLFERFKPLGYQRYVGIDISDVAIGKLQTYSNDRTIFTQADADTYEPIGRFDILVFNESLYYLKDPIGALRRYSRSLKSDGHIIVSTYTTSRRSLAVLREAKQAFDAIDETKTTNGDISWLCTVFRA